ncbi:hypothetical protein ABXS69_10045 [Actinomyces timonensis]|uniref:Uncharacterized protein n=1 Tax=Actinomyces timonensis TaxID=1288391 RepID=A0AAU8N3I3_9ACTO
MSAPPPRPARRVPSFPERIDDAAGEGSGEGASSPGTAAAREARAAEPAGDEPAPAPREAAPAGAAGADRRAARPPIAQGLPLQAYSDDELDDLVAWIRSDGMARSEEEELAELRDALALTRRGTGVDAVLGNAVRRGR